MEDDTTFAALAEVLKPMNTIRKACVQAVFDEFETQGEIVHPFKDVDAEAMRSLGHIVGYVDLDVTGLVDLIIDTINKEL